ncbi:hypothetical protein IP88_15265 [alpha proteobacterium AAP81b]|nr:hypothetical protein IP88_15265 [alpha proteobacterium AAP81b]
MNLLLFFGRTYADLVVVTADVGAENLQLIFGGSAFVVDAQNVITSGTVTGFGFADSDDTPLLAILDISVAATSVYGAFASASVFDDVTLVGGLLTGNDIFLLSEFADNVSSGSGDDNIQTFGGNDTVFGESGGDTVLGGTGDDMIFGQSGIDWLFGEGDDDTLDGGSGDDVLVGGTGSDTYNVDSSGDVIFEEGGDLDGANSSAFLFFLWDGVEDLVLVERSDAVYGVGNSAGNRIFGNAAVNALFGVDGNDSLNGAAGSDFLFGGAGNDTLIGGASFDTDQLVGDEGNDLLNAASGLGDFDLLYGGTGNDVYWVDTFADATDEGLFEGIDTVIAFIPDGGYFLYANVENLTLGGTTSFGVGNDLANILTGNNSLNIFYGGEGNDTIDGGGGTDYLVGQGGADVFKLRPGTEFDWIVDFQQGIDRIDLSAFGFTNTSQLAARLTDFGGTAVVDLGDGDLLAIFGIAAASLTVGDFII